MGNDFKRVIGCGTLIFVVLILCFMSALNTRKQAANAQKRAVVTTSPTVAPTPTAKATATVAPQPTPDYDTILAIECAKSIVRSKTTAEIQFDSSWRAYDVANWGNGQFTVTAVCKMRYSGGSWFNKGWTTTFNVAQNGDNYEWEIVIFDWGA